MASLIELAELSRAAYADGGDVTIEHEGVTKHWWRRRTWRSPVGFHASEFVGDDEVVLAFRGTDDGWDGLVDDLALATGLLPPQVGAALQITADSQADYYTGHSLGGALAIIAGASRRRKAISFNAPGVMDSCVVTAVVTIDLPMLGRCTFTADAVNIRIELDPVSSVFTTGLQTGGRDMTLSAPGCGSDLLCRHGIGTVIESLRHEPTGFHEVPRN